MHKNYDSAIILECTNTRLRPSNFVKGADPERQRMNIIRPLAPFALNDLFVKRNIPSTVINYTEFWDPGQLFETISKWLSNHHCSKPLVLVSALFDGVFVEEDTTLNSFADKIRKEYSLAQIFIGGPLHQQKFKFKPDAVFQGRSLHLFEQWLDDEEIDAAHKFVIDDINYFQNRSGQVVEKPLVTHLYDDYCLNEKDIVTFETRLGCKFNCSFCAYEFRNAKEVNDSDDQTLFNFFLNAYTKYGVTRFSLADDTFNEGDEKIYRLRSATKDLPFKPTIVGFNRFDIMMAKPWQAEIMDECGFVGHYFGIETLHHEASKFIRKGIQKHKAYDFLRYIRDNFPHWWTSSGYIVGLPHEPKQHIKDTFNEIAEEKLLKGLIPAPLTLLKPDSQLQYDAHNSDFVRNPEKFGITVTGKISENLLYWRHEHMDHNEAVLFARKLAKTSKIDTLCGWEWSSKESVGNSLDAADRHISDYISRKINFLKSN